MASEQHRVAIVVFAEAEGVDYKDAAYVAEIAIRQALAGKVMPELPDAIDATIGGEQRLVRLHTAMEVGMAAGNGYLWTAPTIKASRERGM